MTDEEKKNEKHEWTVDFKKQTLTGSGPCTVDLNQRLIMFGEGGPVMSLDEMLLPLPEPEMVERIDPATIEPAPVVKTKGEHVTITPEQRKEFADNRKEMIGQRVLLPDGNYWRVTEWHKGQHYTVSRIELIGQSNPGKADSDGVNRRRRFGTQRTVNRHANHNRKTDLWTWREDRQPEGNGADGDPPQPPDKPFLIPDSLGDDAFTHINDVEVSSTTIDKDKVGNWMGKGSKDEIYGPDGSLQGEPPAGYIKVKACERPESVVKANTPYIRAAYTCGEHLRKEQEGPHLPHCSRCGMPDKYIQTCESVMTDDGEWLWLHRLPVTSSNPAKEET